MLEDDFSAPEVVGEWDVHGAEFGEKGFSVYFSVKVDEMQDCQEGYDVVVLGQLLDGIDYLAFTGLFLLAMVGRDGLLDDLSVDQLVLLFVDLLQQVNLACLFEAERLVDESQLLCAHCLIFKIINETMRI
jgi:hypothetical protein